MCSRLMPTRDHGRHRLRKMKCSPRLATITILHSKKEDWEELTDELRMIVPNTKLITIADVDRIEEYPETN